jgi:predicted DCC family thiol-disulfide oxidoreductase YuxK
VRFLTRHDKQKKLQYASLQSEQATKVFQNHPELLSLKTIVFDNNGQFSTQSDAVLLIFKELGWPYSWVYAFKIIPKFIRDKVYSWVAKNR